MNKFTAFILLSIVCLCGTAAALPSAEFDHGGMAFDLEAISKKRFCVPEGGLNGIVVRAKDSDVDAPSVVHLELHKKSAVETAHSVSLRYRLRVDKYPDDRKREVILIWYFRGKDKNGNAVKIGGSRYRIHDTSGGWREICFPRLVAGSSVDAIDFEFGLNGCLGKLEYKDLCVSEYEDAAGATEGYIVEPIVRPMSFLDNSFALASGQPQLMYFTWRYADPLEKRGSGKYDAKKWSVSFRLPPGVKCLSYLKAIQRNFKNEKHEDGSSTVAFDVHPNAAPYDNWNHWYLMGLIVSSDLPSGSQPGDGEFTAFYDGRVASKPLKVKFSVTETVKAASVPRRYFNGAYIGADPSASRFADTDAAASLIKAWSEAGARSCHGGDAGMLPLLRTNGICRVAAPYRYVADGYNVNPPPGCGMNRPADQKFIPYDTNHPPARLKYFDKASCPVAIYEEASYFRDAVLPMLKKYLSGYDCLETNWEPIAFFGRGCACNRCRAEFAKYAGCEESDVAKDWPACVQEGGRFEHRIERFRAIQHGKVVRTINKYVCEYTGNEKSHGLIPEIAWGELADAFQYHPRQGESDPREYAGSLRWINPWGPYVWWDAKTPYHYQKRLSLASYAAAKNIREFVDRVFPLPNRPKLLSFPSGWQGKTWIAVPEWIGLAMDSFFFNRWEGTSVYAFPAGYDARYWKAFAEATARAGRCEDAVLDGVRSDGLVETIPVPEYAANCRETTGFLPQITNVSTLQAPSYDWKEGRVVGLLNFWEKGEAFLTLKLKRLAPGSYTVISEGKTLWTNPDGGVSWTADELANGMFVAVGAARTVDFTIRPVREHSERKAVNEMSQKAVRTLYEKARSRLQRAADEDRASERMRGLLYPDTLPQI
jgi:hypothetical protein